MQSDFIESRKVGAKRRWLIMAQIATTSLALAWVGFKVQWLDRAVAPPVIGAASGPLQKNNDRENLRDVPDTHRHKARETNIAVPVIEPGVWTILRKVRPVPVLGYFVCAVWTAAALSVRWRIILVDDREAPAIAWCSTIWLRSQVISALPVSQVGADVYRASKLLCNGRSVSDSIGVVAIERVFGLIALLGVAVTALGVSRLLPWNLAIGGTIAGLCVTLGLVWGARQIAAIQLLRHRFCRSRIWQVGLDSLAMLRRALGDSRNRTVILALSIAVHALSPLSFVFVDRALGFGTPAWCYFVAVPGVSLAQYLPIHIGGIGILEGGLWVVLGNWADRTPADIVALSAVIRVLGLVWLSLLAFSFAQPIPQFVLGNKDETAAIQPRVSNA